MKAIWMLLFLCQGLLAQDGLVIWVDELQVWKELPATDIEKIDKFGRNPVINAATEEDIWDIDADYPVFDDDSTITVVSSTANDDTSGGGALKGMVVGLDSSFVKKSEYFYLDGTNPVTLTNKYRVIYRAWIDSTEGDNSSGDITFSAPVQSLARIAAGRGQTLMAVYCIEKGKKGVLKSFYGTINKISASGAANYILMTKDLTKTDSAWRTKKILGSHLNGSGYVPFEFPNPLILNAGTMIKIRASVSANSTDVSAGFYLELQDENKF